jgi:hypothetical protein
VELARGEYHQIYSFYCSLRGDLAFEAQEYELAFEQYTEQCRVGTHFKQATYERGIDHLGERLQGLGETDPQRALAFMDKIIASWMNDPQVADRTELVEELREVRRTLEESEKLKQLKALSEEAMRQGQWAEAARYSDEILNIPALHTDANRAEVLLAKSRAAHRQEHFTEARRYAKVALQLGRLLKVDSLTGNAHLALTSILWDTTSTAESAEHLKAAMQIFTRLKDQVGLARAQRFHCYILYRTGHYDQLIEPLRQVAQVFEAFQMTAEAAEARNLISRVARTKLVLPDYDLARKSAAEALQQAQASGNAYRIAECLLSLAALCQREQDYPQVLDYYAEGIQLLPAEAHAIRTVYEGICGAAYFEMASQSTGDERAARWDQAFMAFSRELAEAAQSKPASLVHSIEWLFTRLTQLPSAAELARYAQAVEQQVSELLAAAPQRESSLREVQRVLAQAQQFYAFLQADLS